MADNNTTEKSDQREECYTLPPSNKNQSKCSHRYCHHLDAITLKQYAKWASVSFSLPLQRGCLTFDSFPTVLLPFVPIDFFLFFFYSLFLFIFFSLSPSRSLLLIEFFDVDVAFNVLVTANRLGNCIYPFKSLL